MVSAKYSYAILFLILCSAAANAQQNKFITKRNTEQRTRFAMPLYLDLPGEMGVEKGYKEINILAGYNSYKTNNTFRTLVEFAFAPAKRLSFEVELPFSFVKSKTADNVATEIPLSRLEGIKLGGMYAFKVLPMQKAVLSAGFFNEFEASPFKHFAHPLLEGNVFHPFIGAAKVWNKKLHTLLYAGPSIHSLFKEKEKETVTDWKINTTLSYHFGERENYAGMEVNQTVYKAGYFETILRPQVHLFLAQQWALGLGVTVPAHAEGMNGGGFLRLIYMPGNN